MQPRSMPAGTAAVAVSLVSILAGCATVAGGAADDAQNDPLEPFNRGVLTVNRAVDRTLGKPIAEAYRAALPDPIRDGIRAFIDNLREPLIFVNDLLQGRGEAAGVTGRRFLINSTLGLGGFFDRATALGEIRQSGDFGQTLYVWGAGDGPYLMLPLLGPSNVRDVVGLGVDAYTSPVGQLGSDATKTRVTIGVGVSDGIDLRSRNIESIDAIETGSLDYYAYLRSVWRQHRQATLREAREGPPQDDELIDPGATPPVKTGPRAP